MNTELRDILKPIIDQYDEGFKAWRANKSLKAPDPEKEKTRCISEITGRMEALSADDLEYKELSFIVRALGNGWTVSDIMTLSTFYNTAQRANGTFKVAGNKIIDQLASTKVNSLYDRFSMMDTINNYVVELSKVSSNSSTRNAMFSIGAAKSSKIVYPQEYPQDTDFAKTAGLESAENGTSYNEIFQDKKRFDAYMQLKKAHARENTEYIIDEVSEAKRATEREAIFVPNDAQRHNGITISASKAISTVLGDETYDEIDEMSRGTLSDRKVKLHHASGTKHQKEGCHVLEMEFAGSGGQDVVKLHQGRDGDLNTKNMTPEDIKAKYGTAAQAKGEEPLQYVRLRERTVKDVNGNDVTKKRYTFSGPTPSWKILRGLINLGPYSIESSRENARKFARDFLEPLFDSWLKNGVEPKPIHIDLSGVSRGAVAAGQSAKTIHEWIDHYCKTHPGAENFEKDFVHYDLRLFDPVPGAITNSHLGSCNLHKIPNLNTTVFCSMGIKEYDFAFPLQHVKGAKKVILTMTDHTMDLTRSDYSQMNTIGDAQEHLKGYYDAETGEMHRGSGLNELPDGVYFSDEKHNLIRITSFSQVNELFATSFDKSSPQRIRARRIHEMARDWFLENHLEMSFPDEQTRKTQEGKNEVIQEKILKTPSKKSLVPIKRAINDLNDFKKTNPSKEELIKKNKELIEVCRNYMKEVKMPAYGDNAYKIGLVSDTLSYTMRLNNQLNIELGNNPPSAVDQKIKAHQERLQNKEGYLERKQEAESKRLEQEKNIQKLVQNTAKKCEDALKILDKTRVGKSGSSSYKKLHKILEEGSQLGDKTSISDMSDFLKRFTDLSKNYTSSHKGWGGPRTNDGKTRLTQSETLGEFGEDSIKDLEKFTAGLGDKNMPIGLRVEDRSGRLQEIQQKLNEKKAKEVQEEAKEEIPEAAPAL